MITGAERVETDSHPLQPPLWDWAPGGWLSVIRATPYTLRQPRPADPGWQLPLPFADLHDVARS